MSGPAEMFQLRRSFTIADLFRFSAVTWNAHRIHYDADFARGDGLPDAVVQSHLHGALVAEALRRWAGPRSRLRSLDWRNTAAVSPEHTVTVRGRVTKIREERGRTLVDCELDEVDQSGQTCVVATATVEIGSHQ